VPYRSFEFAAVVGGNKGFESVIVHITEYQVDS
jgi:hypothetical protein